MIFSAGICESDSTGKRDIAIPLPQNEDSLATAVKSTAPTWETAESKHPSQVQAPAPVHAESQARLKSQAPDVRRKFERKDIQLDVSLYSDSNFYAGFTENLSAGGVFIATHNLLKIGEKIDITITMPTEKKVIAHGIVRWLRVYNESSDSPPGMGIQFLNLDGEDLIKEFLAARAPLFYDDE